MPLEKLLDRLNNWAFVSNGIMSADKRIVDNTKRIEKLEDRPNEDCCLFVKYQKEMEGMKEKRRAFRATDITNIIAALGILFLIFERFF